MLNNFELEKSPKLDILKILSISLKSLIYFISEQNLVQIRQVIYEQISFEANVHSAVDHMAVSNAAFSKSFWETQDIVAHVKLVHAGHFPCHVRSSIPHKTSPCRRHSHFHVRRHMSHMACIFAKHCREVENNHPYLL